MYDNSELDYTYLQTLSARSAFANVSLTMVETGIHLFMATYGLVVFFETPPAQRRGRLTYIFITFTITLLTALTGSLEPSWIFRILLETTAPEEFWEVRDRYPTTWEQFVSMSALTAVVIVGDGLLLYRCYRIWIHRRWVVVIPALTYLASTGVGILILVSQSDASAIYTTSLQYETAYVFLTVSTNLLITILISFYLLNERRKLSQFLPSHELRIYTGIVAVLVESALPVTVFGIVYAAIVVVDPAQGPGGDRKLNERYAANFVLLDIFGYLFYAFTALSPHTIIFRVTIGRSWSQSPPDCIQSNGEAVSASIAFDHNGANLEEEEVPGHNDRATHAGTRSEGN